MRESPIFTEAGRDTVTALDGRIVSTIVEAGLLRAPEVSKERMRGIIAHLVFGDVDKPKNCVKALPFFAAANRTTKPTKGKGRQSARRTKVRDNEMYTKELYAVPCRIRDRNGKIEEHELGNLLQGLGSTVAFSMATAQGGEKRRASVLVGHVSMSTRELILTTSPTV